MKPKTRLDNFLAKIAKDPDADSSMEPKSREEHYLNKIAENGGSGSGYTITEERTIIVPEQTAETQTYTDYARIYLTDISVMAPDQMPNTLIATYNCNEYRLPKVETSGNVIGYGEMNGRLPIFTTYPCVITFMFDDTAITDGNLLTPTAQTAVVKAEAATEVVTPSEEFKEAVAGASKPFVVTLTPTATNLSGTMDKTVGEINEAYQAGRKIVFKVTLPTYGTFYLDCNTVYGGDDSDYLGFEANVINWSEDLFINAGFPAQNDDGSYSYSTHTYSLTPVV